MAENPIESPSVPDNQSGKPVTSSATERATAAMKGAGQKALDASKVVGAKLSAATRATSDRISNATTVMADLNGDGKVDQEDARIAVGKGKEVAIKAASEAGELGKKVLRDDMVKDAAAGASIGALVAIPVPLIGPAVGAAVGAVAGVIKNIVTSTRK